MIKEYTSLYTSKQNTPYVELNNLFYFTVSFKFKTCYIQIKNY